MQPKTEDKAVQPGAIKTETPEEARARRDAFRKANGQDGQDAKTPGGGFGTGVVEKKA